MGLWQRLFGERKMTSLDLFRMIGGTRESRTGVSITVDRALQVSTVLACCRVRANGISQVPFNLYQKTGTTRRVATDHPLYMLMHRRPNPWQTAYEFRETLSFHLDLTGNAYIWKGMVGRAREVRSLELIEPHRVRVERNARTAELTYKVHADDGAYREFTQDEIWHIRGPSWNSWLGMDVLAMAREAIGLAVATEGAHADMHKGAARISGMLSVEDTLSKEKFDFLSGWLDAHAEGGSRAGKPIIVDRGAKFTPMAMTGVDAQHLETRKHQVEEICREFGVMPIMVGYSENNATYASAEQMFLAHQVHCLAPIYSRIEQSADKALLSEDDLLNGYYFKFNANAMMRGAAADRSEFYAKALGAGGHGTAYMTVNEIRELEDRDPIAGGDELPKGPPTANTPADNGGPDGTP